MKQASARRGRPPASVAQRRRARVLYLISEGKVTTLTCAAQLVGVSRERVRQIVREEGILFQKTQRNTLITWPCPQCGGEAQMWTKERNSKAATNPALCSDCRKGSGRFCRRGHENPPRAKNGGCKTCMNDLRRTVIAYRTCMDCGKQVPITRGIAAQIKLRGHPAPKRCQPCRIRKFVQANVQTHCIRGHLLAETRRRSTGGTFCVVCNRERSREHYYRKKAKAG